MSLESQAMRVAGLALEAAKEVLDLRAVVERLTKERDEARRRIDRLQEITDDRDVTDSDRIRKLENRIAAIEAGKTSHD